MRMYCIIIALFIPTICTASFPDTQANWYKQSIEQLQSQGVVQGYSDGFFKPHATITRAEFLKITLALAKPISTPTETDCFPDVAADAWYSSIICEAKKRGVATGHSDGLFRPNDPITIHEGLAFAFRSQNITIPAALEPTWFSGLEKLADKAGIMPISSYNTTTQINRGLATQIADATKRYALVKQQNAYQFSTGCKDPTNKMPQTLTIGGIERTYILDLPKDFSATKPYGIIFGFHGRTNTNTQVRNYTRLHNGQTNFITVYPQAIIVPDGTHNWSNAANIEFIDQLLANLSTSYCIDRTKIFAVGHSLGGWFAQKAACVRGGVFRGVAVVGSGDYAGPCTGPAASMLLHNPNDWAISTASAQQAFTIRSKRNECSTVQTSKVLNTLDCTEASTCRSGNNTIFCTYTEAPYGSTHGWPRAATPMILKFLKELP